MSYINSDFVASAHNSIRPCQLQDTVAMLQQVSMGRYLIQSHAACAAKWSPTTHKPYDHYKQRVSSYKWKPDQPRYSQDRVNSHSLSKDGQTEALLLEGSRFNNAKARVTLLSSIVKALIQTGQKGKARQIATDALNAVCEIESAMGQSYALSTLAGSEAHTHALRARGTSSMN